MRILLLIVGAVLLTACLEAKEIKNKKYCFKVEIPDNYKTTEGQMKNGSYILETLSDDELSHLYLIAVKAEEGSQYKWLYAEKMDSLYFKLSDKIKESKPIYSHRIKRSYSSSDGWNSETTTIYAKDYCYVFLHLYKESADTGNEIINSFSASHANGVLNFIELIFSRISEGGFMSFIFLIFQIVWCTVLFFLSLAVLVACVGEKKWNILVKIVVSIVVSIVVGFIFLYLTLHDPLVDFIEGYIGIGGLLRGIAEMFT